MRAQALLALGAIVGAVLGGCVMLRGKTEHGRLVAALPPESERLGWEQCIDCHTTVGDWFAASRMHAKNPGCETCHGAGGMHVSDGPGNIVGEEALEHLSPLGKSEMCLECHVDRAVDWPRSHHARGGLACAECHTDAVHFKQDDAVKAPAEFDRVTTFCVQCHESTAADFKQPFSHPVDEGAMECNACHDAHGAQQRRPEIAGTEACATCHAEEAGPKVFRHEALDEGCNVCHMPHGGPLKAMLSQDGNGICLQCHHDAAFPVIEGVDHTSFLAQESRCWDCHTELHGSNSDPSLLGRLR